MNPYFAVQTQKVNQAFLIMIKKMSTLYNYHYLALDNPLVNQTYRM